MVADGLVVRMKFPIVDAKDYRFSPSGEADAC